VRYHVPVTSVPADTSLATAMKGFLSIVFFANMWQLLLSLLYMCINALLTCFSVEAEWQSYAVERKNLRVSSPIGQQRSTYFLSLPWRYGLPLMATFTILHWTLSQSIFLTVVSVYKPKGFDEERLFLGSSPRPLMASKSTPSFFLRENVSMALLSLCSCSHWHPARDHCGSRLFSKFQRHLATRRQL
jgi:hypothetical protein